MADDISKVIINGLGNSVPKWASEDTIRIISKDITHLVSILDKKAKVKALKTKGSQDALDSFEKTMKDIDKEQQEQEKKIKKQHKTTIDQYKESTDHFKTLNDHIKEGNVSFSVLSSVGASLGGVMSSLLSPSALLGTSFALLGVAGEEFFKYLTHTTQALLGLYDSGILFTDSVAELRKAAADAGQPLDEFAKLLVSNSGLIKSFGADGALQFGKLAKQTRELTKANGYWGLQMQAINEYTADYLEQLRKQGVSTRWMQINGAQASATYIEQLTAYSQILGKSREQIAKEMKDAKKSPGIKSILATMSAEQQQVYQNLIGQISGTFGEAAPQVIDAFNEMFKGPLGQTTEFAKALQTTSPELYRQLWNLAQATRQGVVSTKQGGKELSTFTYGLQNMSDEQHKAIMNMILYQKSLSEGATALESAGSEIQGIKFDALGNVIAKAPDEISKNLNDLSIALQEVKNTLAGAFADFLHDNQGFLKQLVVNLKEGADWLLNTIKDLMNPATRDKVIGDLKSGFDSLMNMIMKALSDAIGDAIDVALHLATPQDIENRRKLRNQKGGPDAIDDFNSQSFLGKGLNMAGRGLGAMWNGVEYIAGGQYAADAVNAFRGPQIQQPSPIIPAAPKITPPVMPLPPSTTVAPADPTSGADMSDVVDQLKQTNQHLQMNNALTSKGNEISKDIKQNLDSSGNVIR